MKKRRGYILLTVLLLLMLAAVAMAAVCRLAIRRSLEASAASDELQRRWGTISCRDAILPNAENLLEIDESPASPVTRVHAEFSLGTEQFAVDISDEQAKVNVNALYALQGKDRAEQSIQKLVSAAGGDLKPRLRLAAAANSRPKSAPLTKTQNPADQTDDPNGAGYSPPVFGSWSEIFPDVRLSVLLPGSPRAITSNLTCWGNGSLNLRRASPASVTQLCSPTLSPGQISQLLVLRSHSGDSATVEQLFAAAHVGTEESLNLSGRLTLTSAVQSLWITSHDHNQTQHSLIIRDSSNSGDPRSFSFQW